MSEMTPIEGRVARWMLEDAPDEAPDRVLRATFDRTRLIPQDRGWRARRPVRTRTLVLAAAVVLLAASMTILAVGGLRSVPQPAPSPDALQRVLDAGVVRVAVSTGHPQRLAGDRLDGFDVDLAQEVGRRLGVRTQVVELAASDMAERQDTWDVALAPVKAGIDPVTYAAVPTYAWPHLLLVPSTSGATSVDDVRGQPICAVTGDEGLAWLLGSGGDGSGGSSTPPIPSTLLLKATDSECVDLLRTGQVRALVTATMSPAEAAQLDGVQALPGPQAETRAAFVRRDGDASRLAEAVRRAVDAARADGTLAARSVDRFGTDLSSGLP